MKNLKKYLILAFALLVCSWLFSQPSPTLPIVDVEMNSMFYSLEQETLYNPSLPLSQQNWKELDFTQLSLSELIQASETESTHSANLIQQLQEQQISSEIQIQQLQSYLQSSQDVLTKLQHSLSQQAERLQQANEDWYFLDLYAYELEEDLKESKTKQRITFYIGFFGAGAGGSLLTAGLLQDNRTMVYTGGGILLGTGLIYLGVELYDYFF